MSTYSPTILIKASNTYQYLSTKDQVKTQQVRKTSMKANQNTKQPGRIVDITTKN